MPKNSGNLEKDQVEKILFETALRYLGYRDRFKKEIELRLKKKILQKKLPENAKDIIPSILEKLEKNGLINDSDLVATYINTQHKNHLRGPFLIKNKLFRLGAPQDQVKSWLSKLVTPDSQKSAIDKLVKKRRPTLETFQDTNRFKRFLISRGFDLNLVNQKIAFVDPKG
jgi:SOS response regulatory protein OraA/RecX